MSVCENCGDSYLSAYQEATGHHYDEGTILTSPGCETEGLICYVCLNDETHSFAQILPATGHTYQGSICISCGHTLPGAPDHDGALGDVNHDGKINAKDATLILQKSVGVLKANAKFCEQCAEVSGDGKLNAKDSTLILQFSVGLRSSFPAQN